MLTAVTEFETGERWMRIVTSLSVSPRDPYAALPSPLSSPTSRMFTGPVIGPTVTGLPSGPVMSIVFDETWARMLAVTPAVYAPANAAPPAITRAATASSDTPTRAAVLTRARRLRRYVSTAQITQSTPYR